jgi:protocatechuate 3,4-dioxygenase beta subunit
VLNQSGVVRSDIRSSFGGSSGTAEGVPLTIKLAIQDQDDSCAPLAGAAVYLWHCDREGRYSLYSQGVTDQNYLRGVQAAGDEGVVTFTSVFPACYSGRWPHVHFEVYPSLDKATSQGNKIATSQIALPKDVCDTVYATTEYEQSVSNLGQVSLQNDNVFGDDGGARQLGTMSGSVSRGYVVEIAVPVPTA